RCGGREQGRRRRRDLPARDRLQPDPHERNGNPGHDRGLRDPGDRPLAVTRDGAARDSPHPPGHAGNNRTGNPHSPANAGPRPPVSPDAGGSAAAIASGPRVEQPPVTPPTPPGTNLPDFACTDLSGGKTGVANTIAARAGEVQAYDRFVLQFESIVPTYSVK